jgi:hypothetical protein
VGCLFGQSIGYSLEVNCTVPFDLPEFMFSQFNRVDFGGNLFGQWPVGIRFEIGIKQVDRVAQLFNFVFGKSNDFVLVSQDWEIDGTATEQFSLFETQGIFYTQPAQFHAVEVSPFDESEYRLTWTCLSPQDFNAVRLFQAIANREQEGVPKISSGVYAIDPRAKLIMHMYDNRGLDLIATKIETLQLIFDRFRAWILEYERQKIESRFESGSFQRAGETEA